MQIMAMHIWLSIISNYNLIGSLWNAISMIAMSHRWSSFALFYSDYIWFDIFTWHHNNNKLKFHRSSKYKGSLSSIQLFAIAIGIEHRSNEQERDRWKHVFQMICCRTVIQPSAFYVQNCQYWQKSDDERSLPLVGLNLGPLGFQANTVPTELFWYYL